MNQTIYVAVLAILQGVSEFLPISSDGHLVIGKTLLGQIWTGVLSEQGGIQLEVALHFGTLGSILVVFWNDLWSLRRDRRLCLLVVVASIPAGLIGLTFKHQLEALFQSSLVAGCGLIVTAAFLLIGQLATSERYSERNLPFWAAFVVGCFQAVAILPGISRSGSTISAGLLVGMQRTSAATFSFLMAVVAIGGAVVLEAKDLVFDGEPLAYPAGTLALGIAISFVVGIVALKVLMRVLKGRQLHWFAYYCLAVGTATIAWQLLATKG